MQHPGLSEDTVPAIEESVSDEEQCSAEAESGEVHRPKDISLGVGKSSEVRKVHTLGSWRP